MFIAPFQVDVAELTSLDGLFDSLGTDLKFNLWVDTTMAFFEFFFATMLSMAIGFTMSAMNRKVLRIGEFAPARSPMPGGDRRRLCNVLRPAEWLQGKIFAHTT